MTLLAFWAGCRAEPPPGASSAALEEDVFLLSGEIHAVRAATLATPRGQGELQIRWMVDDGAEVKAGDRVIDFDPARVVQGLEEKRLRLREAENQREAREHSLAAEAESKRVAVDKAEVELKKARLDADVPRELRPAVEWRQVQAAYMEKKAALEKARLEQKAFDTAARADLEMAVREEEKAHRDTAASEESLRGMSVRAPRDGIFLVGSYWRWGPEGPRKLQPGDIVWTGFTVATLPDPSEMDVEATLAEVDYGRIAPGMRARCILDIQPGRVFEGRVEEVGVVASPASGRMGLAGRAAGFPVRISLARTDPLMRPGLSVRVEVVRGDAGVRP